MSDTVKMEGDSAPLIEMEEFRGWILLDDEDLLVLDKPGWVVCHPSKNGPMSSLVGAARVFTGLDVLHLVSRLDRETSGLVLLAKNKGTARAFQMALQERKVEKNYLALMEGEMAEAVTVNRRLARDGASPVYVKQAIRKSRTSQRALTHFQPLAVVNGFTLAKVCPETGRKHQIRAHAQWLGHAIVGDKIYGPDENYYLQFIENGWTPEMGESLLLPRQALHARELTFHFYDHERKFQAPFPKDMKSFCQKQMGLDSRTLENLLNLNNQTVTK